jgi:1,4-dihydroxy-2-naphthoate octaprenyltransferase
MIKKTAIWLQAVRPYSLWAAVAPVTIGSAMAYGDGFFHRSSALAALTVAVFIQIGTNLANDYFDFKSGVDRLGHGRPTSAILSGKLTPSEVKIAFVLAFAVAAVAANFLVIRAGIPALIIAVASIISGLLYTAGRWSLSRLGLGDLFVLVFFGPVAVAGTYYVQSFEYNAAVILSGFMPGFLSVAILVVNNLRDIATDTRAGRRTLAVRFGKAFTRMEYLFCILAACAIPVIVDRITGDHNWLFAGFLPVFFAIPLVHSVFTSEDPKVLNRALAWTAILLMVQSTVFSVLWLL